MRLRPPTRALLPSLVVQRTLRRIPAAAVCRLADLAERQSEGAVDRSAASVRYFGSTYFTLPLARVRAAFAGRTVREMTVAGLARAVSEQPLLRLELVRLARAEAELRIAGAGDGDGRGAALVPGTARAAVTVKTMDDAVVVEVALDIPCAVWAPRCASVGAAREDG